MCFVRRISLVPLAVQMSGGKGIRLYGGEITILRREDLDGRRRQFQYSVSCNGKMIPEM
jgi:hypothetical protein